MKWWNKLLIRIRIVFASLPVKALILVCSGMTSKDPLSLNATGRLFQAFSKFSKGQRASQSKKAQWGFWKNWPHSDDTVTQAGKWLHQTWNKLKSPNKTYSYPPALAKTVMMCLKPQGQRMVQYCDSTTMSRTLMMKGLIKYVRFIKYIPPVFPVIVAWLELHCLFGHFAQ